MSLDFGREQIMEGRMTNERSKKIAKVLHSISQAQNVDPYKDPTGKAGFRNPVRPVIGNGLTAIVEKLGIRSGVELGTALGRSGLHMAQGGMEKLDTVEFDPEAAGIAQANFKAAGVKFSVHCMDSGNFTRNWDEPIEFLFVDHAKPRYLEDLQALEGCLTPQALVLMDNTFNRASECQEAVSYVAANYYSSIFTEPPTGEDGLTTGLLVASKDRQVYDTAMNCLQEVR